MEHYLLPELLKNGDYKDNMFVKYLHSIQEKVNKNNLTNRGTS